MRLVGLGVDLMSLSRARQFIRRHRCQAFKRLLTESEKKRFREKDLTPLQFSKLFTAKEAFFKALGESGMGLEGFRFIEVKLLPGGRFRVKSIRPHRRREGEAVGTFFQNHKFVGAHVMVWR